MSKNHEHKQNQRQPVDFLAQYEAPQIPNGSAGTFAMSATNPDDGCLYVCVCFENRDICRSQQLFKLAVAAAVNAIWSPTYHALFGREALEACNMEMVRDSSLEEWELFQNAAK